jgi:signal transduction histidine kinase
MKVLARFAGIGRIVLAVGLLAVLWIGTVNGVERASRGADDRRASDRSAVASGFASSIRDWLDAGRTEAASLSRTVGVETGSAAQGAIETFLAQPRTFTRDAIVFQGTTVTAASPRYAVLVGLQPKPCTSRGEVGPTDTDTRLLQLVASAHPDAGPVVSQIFDVPGVCLPAVGIAVAAGGSVTVVLGSVDDASSRMAAGSLIAVRGTRILLVTGDVALEPRLGVGSVPPRVASFVRSAAEGGPQRARVAAGDARVLEVYAPVGAGWSVVLEQDAAVFDIELQSRPSVIVASVLTVLFAVVFALIAFFDIRRRRAHRRAEVAKNEFFSVAGHELRTPLTVIKGFADLLSSDWADLDEESRRTLVERIVPQTRRLDRLVERLLVAASIQSETHTRPQVQAVAVPDVLDRVAEQFRREAPLHSFVVQAGRDVPRVRADARALDQVLQHLVDNAVKYSPAGGQIWLRVVPRARWVDIVVEDEGIGLPSDYRSIFEKFAQGESVTKRVHDEGGVGLGLYIVRTLVEDMGGSVRAEPRSPEGARFVVSLRTAETDQRPTVPKASTTY